MSQILIERTKKTDNNKKIVIFVPQIQPNSQFLYFGTFSNFRYIKNNNTNIKHSNRRFWKLVDRFPKAFATPKFVFIIDFTCSFVYFAYNFLLFLSKLSSIRYFKHDYMLIIHNTYIMFFIKLWFFGTTNKYDVTTFEVSFVCSSICGRNLFLCSHPNCVNKLLHC